MGLQALPRLLFKVLYVFVFAVITQGTWASDSCGDSISKLISEIEYQINSNSVPGSVRRSYFERSLGRLFGVMNSPQPRVDTSNRNLIELEYKWGKYFSMSSSQENSFVAREPLTIELSNKWVLDLADFLRQQGIPIVLSQKNYYSVADTKQYYILEFESDLSWPIGTLAKMFEDFKTEYKAPEKTKVVFDPFMYQRLKLRESKSAKDHSLLWPEDGVFNIHPRDLILSLKGQAGRDSLLSIKFYEAISHAYLMLNASSRARWSLLGADKMTINFSSEYMFVPLLARLLEIKMATAEIVAKGQVEESLILRLQNLIQQYKKELSIALINYSDLWQAAVKINQKIDSSARMLQVDYQGDMLDLDGMFSFKDLGAEEIFLAPGQTADFSVHVYKDKLVGQNITALKFMISVSELNNEPGVRSYSFDVFDRVLVSEVVSILKQSEFVDLEYGDLSEVSVEAGHKILLAWANIFNGSSSEFAWLQSVFKKQLDLTDQLETQLHGLKTDYPAVIKTISEILERQLRFDEI